MTHRRILAPEGHVARDESTGRTVRQVTTAPAIHHHPFFLAPAYDDAMRHLVFVSHRTGKPQVYFEERSSGRLIQLTDVEGLQEWSIHPSHDGRYVYYTTGDGGYRVETSTAALEQLVAFGDRAARGGGMVAAGMGTTAVSRDDRFWALKTHASTGTQLLVVETSTCVVRTILERDTIAHLQFCPDDSDLIFYAGPFKDRVWTVRRDGSENRRHYLRQPGEWITHESWIPGTHELAFVDWPKGVRAIHVDTGAERTLARFNAWHAIADRSGTRMVTDTNFPDTGIWTFALRGGAGERELLCVSASSNQGDHWAGPFPYEDGPIAVRAPQHTHPHPTFSPDGRFVVFGSDQSGHAQIYEVQVGAPSAVDRRHGATG